MVEAELLPVLCRGGPQEGAFFKCEASPDCVAITNITNKYRKSFWVCRASRERIDGKKGSAAYEKLSGEKAYPPRVESGHRREPWTHARDKTVHNKGAAPLHLIDEDILVDTGSAMGLLWLRTPTDVDIISQPGPFVPTLTRSGNSGRIASGRSRTANRILPRRASRRRR